MITKKAYLFTQNSAEEIASLLISNYECYLEDIEFILNTRDIKSISDNKDKIIQYLNEDPKECAEWFFHFEGVEYDDFKVDELADNFFIFHFFKS